MKWAAVLLAMFIVGLSSQAQATVRKATPANFTTIAAAMVAGDYMVFGPGAYRVATRLDLVNGASSTNPTKYMCQPGAILYGYAVDDIFGIKSGTNHDITVSGCWFDGSYGVTEAGIEMIGNFGGVNIGNILIANNTFTNFPATSSAVVDNKHFSVVRVENNAFYNFSGSNSGDAIGGTNQDDSPPNHDVSIVHNYIAGMGRIGIEIGGHTQFNNLTVAYNTVIGMEDGSIDSFADIGISIIDDSSGATGTVIVGNTLYNASIELAGKMDAFNNVLHGKGGYLFISHGPQRIWGNICLDNTLCFQKDGGYTATQWIGTNLVNGTVQVGPSPPGDWPAYANDGTITPVDCTPKTWAQLDTLFATAGAAGRITPTTMRDFSCSTAPSVQTFPNWAP